MAVNLVKHQEEMLRAWQEVVDDKNPTNWALFSYEGQTYDLKLAGKGDGGITELADDLNSSKIMYAFCRIRDPKTSLPKYVLINWQGESTPAIKKGTCANHLSAIQKFFKGIHVTVNARTEDEVEEEAIVDKVAKSSGSVYSFNRIENREDEQTSGPVGSIYKRVNPKQEIDAKARDSFWAKEEEEEKKRQLEELKRKEEERKRNEEELKKREIEGSRAREHQVLARMRSISELRQAEEKASNRSDEAEKAKWARQKQDDDNDEEERRMRSEILRRQRSTEAQTLIRQRSVDARAIFEQNTSAGQLSVSRRSSSSNMSSPSPTPTNNNGRIGAKWPPSSPSAASPTPVSPTPPAVIHQQTVPTTFYSNPTSPSPTLIANNKRNAEESNIPPPAPAGFTDESPPEPAPTSPALAMLSNNGHHHHHEEEESNGVEEDEWGAPSAYGTAEPVIIEEEEGGNHVSNYIENDGNDYGVKARALYDYQAGEPGEISFDPGDIITNVDQIDEGWWQGVGPDGTYGLFPANYVELID